MANMQTKETVEGIITENANDNTPTEGFKDSGGFLKIIEEQRVPQGRPDTGYDSSAEESEWSSTDVFNVYSPMFGTGFNTGLTKTSPYEDTGWRPQDSEWVQKLSVEDRTAIAGATSEEYASQVVERRGVYARAEEKMASQAPIASTIAGVGASIIDPFMVLPIGVTAKATQAAYTLGTKALRLSTLSAESAAVGIASVSAFNAAEQGQGLDGTDYGTLNLYAGLFAGGLPIIGSMLSSGHSSAKIAKALTTDPKNFVAVMGETTLEQVGGTQLRTAYTKWMPKFMQSDVTFTASSNNEYVTLISNRIDSPPMAVIDKNTGQPVAIPTTGQDYKQKFNGKQHLLFADTRALQKESTISNLEDFNIEVGRVVRARASKQEQATYKELNEKIAFTRQELKLKAAKDKQVFLQGVFNMTPEEAAAKGVEPVPKKPTKVAIKEYEEALKLETDKQIAEEVSRIKQEVYSENVQPFFHKDPKVVEAAEKVDAHYLSVLEEGKRLKIAELSHIKPDKHYMTRIFDFQKIREMDTEVLISKLEKGLKSHAANSGSTAKAITATATSIAKQLKEADYTREWADFNFFVPKEIGSTNFLKTKRLKLNDEVLEDLLVTDIEDVMGQYSYSQAGHFAANNAFPELVGVPREEQLETFQELFIRPLIDSKAPAKEVTALKNMFEDMLGTFRMAKDSNSAIWKGTRIMNSINSLTYGGAFALNNAAELGGLLLAGSTRNIMKTRLSTLKEVGTMFTKGKVTDPLARDFILMGQFDNLLETHNMMKMADTDAVFNVNKVEHNMNKATNEFFKYNGLRGAQVALESIVGPKVIHDIMDMGAKKSLPLRRKKYLARIGLSPEDASYIYNTLKKNGEFVDGKIADMHLEKWDEKGLDKLTTAVERGMRHTIIKGDSTYLPSWMIKPNPFTRSVTQFLRYPMAATETLMARGMDESQARWLAATMTSTFFMASTMYTREQAALSLGLIEEVDAKYNNFLEDDEHATALFIGAFSKAGTLGGMMPIIERLSAVGGVPMPGHEYAPRHVAGAVLGPTFGRLQQAHDVLEPIFSEGRIDTKQQWNALGSATPGLTFPLVSEYFRAFVKEKGI